MEKSNKQAKQNPKPDLKQLKQFKEMNYIV